MLKVVKGNLIDLAEAGFFNVIVQGCNCFCTMGSGLAREIRERYPKAYEVDTATVSGDRNKLGSYSVMLGKRFNIINAYTQYGFNRNGETNDLFEYAAFQQILNSLAEEYPTCNFGFPLIGCGLAGGNREVVIRMLESFSRKIEKTGGTVCLVEFG